MKKMLLFLAGSLCALASPATVRTVDNNIPGGGQYTSLSAAQSASSAGDTIYIMGSPFSYGNFQFTKSSLVLIGTGHNPQNDNKQVSILDDITFASSITDTKVIGVSFQDYTVGYQMGSFSVVRCLIRNIIYLNGNLSNGLIEGNVFAGGTNIFCNNGSAWSNVAMRNNVFNGSSSIAINSSSTNVLFLNNLFLTLSSSGNAFVSANDLVLRNNIFSRVHPTLNVSRSIFENNVRDLNTTGTFTGSTGNTYTSNTQADPKFVNYPTAGAGFDYSHDYRLQGTSTLINAGTDGKDIGLTGGNGYFNINGIPPIPQIRKFDITTPANGIVTPGSSITIDLRSTIKQ